ncbi:hypothetical protein [Modestobacter marinus]|uniref:hypothetical protein n=1 Tax=Modestobacter marinus TaxID=477641 RepID=UPI001C96B4FE|nr:hypothetical protein [Modestobacter marinus]
MDPTSDPTSGCVPSAEVQCAATRAAFERSGLSPGQLWTRYLALGGIAGEGEVGAYLLGLTRLPAEERDLVAHAVNERLDELAPPRAPYSRSLGDVPGSGGPLSALLGVVAAAHRTPDPGPEPLSRTMTSICPVCERAFCQPADSGRRRVYDSEACRAKAYRRRRTGSRPAPAGTPA